MLSDPRKELFTQKWHETGNKSEGYRYAFPASLKWKDATVHNKASAMSKDDEVKARFAELQTITANTHNVTVSSLIDELNENRRVALSAETPQASAANAATMGKAKLCGLDVVVAESNTEEVMANAITSLIAKLPN